MLAEYWKARRTACLMMGTSSIINGLMALFPMMVDNLGGPVTLCPMYVLV